MNITHFSKLKWACRRGMLELDVLLGNFLEEHYRQASLADQEKFIELLACNDQELFMWLTGKEPAKPQFIDIIGKIRHHAQIRKHSAFI